jgi:hypothetical protein
VSDEIGCYFVRQRVDAVKEEDDDFNRLMHKDNQK